LEVNKYFSWSLLNIIIAMYFQYLYFKKEESKYFRSFYIYYTTEFLKILLFQIKKPFSLIAKGLEIVRLPRQDEFRNFCISDETENVYQKLEEVISNF